MNLITDRWIPVRTVSNQSVVIKPSEIVSYKCFLDFPRPDFNFTGLLFLIGLVQLVRNLVTHKPDEKLLSEFLSPFIPYFNLIGSGNLFMQDRYLTGGKSSPIFSLFLDGVKENEIKLGKDFFRKRNTIEALCPSCSAIALYTTQVLAPVGGNGYNPSPLNNLLMFYNDRGDLWDTVYANTSNDFKRFGNGQSPRPSIIFPWSSPSRDLRVYRATHIPAEHLYWFTPWRFKLLFGETKGTCDCCGKSSKLLAHQFLKSNKGIKYDSTKIINYLGQPTGIIQTGDIGEIQDEQDGTVQIFFGKNVIELDSNSYEVLDEFRWEHPLATSKEDKNLTAAFFRVGHIIAAKILYGIDSFETRSPMTSDSVVLCGSNHMKAANSKYVSWVERSFAVYSDKKNVVSRLLHIEQELWGIFYKWSFKIGNRNDVQRSFEDSLDTLFWDLIQQTPADMEVLWRDQVARRLLAIFDSSITENGLRNRLIAELMELSVNKISIPKQKKIQKPITGFSRGAISVIMRWWSWINNYSKLTKIELRNAHTWEEIKTKEGFIQKLFIKLSHELYPEMENEKPPEGLIDKMAIAAFLAVQLKNDDKKQSEWPEIETNFFENVSELQSFFRNKKDFNVIKIFHKILF